MKRKKTEISKKSNNPAFQESFNFKADKDDVESFGVRVTAMQHLPFPEKGEYYSRAYFWSQSPSRLMLIDDRL